MDDMPMADRQQPGDGWNWDDLRLFLPVARAGSLTEAAGLLGLSISTMARRLTQLESDLGLTLFLRSQSGYALTEDGQRLFKKAEAVETAMFGVNRLADAVATRGRVRVTLPEGFALQIIVPRLPVFREAHPAIGLDLITGHNVLDLMRRESDIALRVAKPNDNDLIARKLGVMAHGAYAARHLKKKQGHDLPKLGWPAEMTRLPIAVETARWIKETSGDPASPPDLTFNGLNVLIVAANAGLGQILLPCVIGDAVPTLRRLAGPDGFFTQDIFLAYHRDLRHNPRIRAVGDFLADSMLAATDRLLGRASRDET